MTVRTYKRLFKFSKSRNDTYLIPPNGFLQPLWKSVVCKLQGRKSNRLTKSSGLIPTLQPLDFSITAHRCGSQIPKLLLRHLRIIDPGLVMQFDIIKKSSTLIWVSNWQVLLQLTLS